VPDYLGGRGLASALEDSSPWRIGYAPKSWTALTDHLREAGYTDRTLEAAGLALTARTGRMVDRFRDRLTLPLRDGDGRVVAFVGRADPDAGQQTPKYLNSPTTPVYRKGEHLLGLYEGGAAAARGATPVVVEGPVDALAVWVASGDRHAAVALCGTALTARQADRLFVLTRGPGAPVIVAMDTDDAGRAAAEVSFRRLTARGLQPWAVNLPPGIDPAEVLEKHGPRRLAAALTSGARPLIDDVIEHRVVTWSDRLRWVEGRVGAVRDVAPFIAALPPDLRPRSIAGVVDLVGIEAATACREVEAAVPATEPVAVVRSGGVTNSPSGRRPAGPCTSSSRRTVVHKPISR
jgi:DNA primase catalytic core